MKRSVFSKVPSGFDPREHRLDASLPPYFALSPETLEQGTSRPLQILSLTLPQAVALEKLEAIVKVWTAEIPWLRLTPTPAWSGLLLAAASKLHLERLESSFSIETLNERWRASEGFAWIGLSPEEPERLWLGADARLFDVHSLQSWLSRLAQLCEAKELPSTRPEPSLELGKPAAPGIKLAAARTSFSWRWSDAARRALSPSEDFWLNLLQVFFQLSEGEAALPIAIIDPELFKETPSPVRAFAPPPEDKALSLPAALARSPSLLPALPEKIACSLSVRVRPHHAIVLHSAHVLSPGPLHFHFDPDADGIQHVSSTDSRWTVASLKARAIFLDELLAASQREAALTELRFPLSLAALQSDSSRAYPLEQTIPQLLEASFSQFAASTAVDSLEGSMSYAQLDRSSRQIALYLQSYGIGPGDLVGLSVARSPLMIAALLGILRTGAAYVPLDPAFPEERLRFMVQDANIKALIAEQNLLHLCPQGALQVAAQDLPRLQSLHEADAWREPAIESRSLAYVIYTSGSTGKPKGVMLAHRSVVNFLLSMRQAPGMMRDDRMLAVTTLSFDIAVLEIFLPLLVGAQLYLANTDEVRDGRLMRTILEQRAITHFQATPSMYRLLLDAGWRGSQLKKALCGGEAFPADVARLLLPCVAEVWNMYGPTETTVWSTIYRLEGAEIQVPIGRPIANTQIYILDESMRELPPGSKGEIYIGGEGLALAYLGRPELTAERFLLLGDRLVYRTGDLGRISWDGTFEIFGRLDQQIKLRGYRMELGEIEAQLSHLPGINHCVAAVHSFGPDDQRLVAYVTARGAWNEKLVRSELKKILPHYMLPQIYVVLPSFPTLPNGKIDRKQLPHPQQLAREPAEEKDQSSNRGEPSPLSLAPLPVLKPLAEGSWPLTPSQERMLYIEQLDPGTTVHNLMGAWLIQGPLDVAAFKQAIQALILEQEALRMVIDRDGRGQRLAPPFDVELPLAVLHQIPFAMQEIEKNIREIGERHLDLSRAPHFHMGLFRLPNGHSVFFLLTHHIFWDGFSYGVFWRQLNAHYGHYLEHGRVELKAPAYNFSTYALARQKELGEAEMAEQLSYWLKRFSPLPEPLELVTDRPRPNQMQHAADTVWIPWDLNLDQRLQHLSKQSGATLYHMLLAASFCLLYRLSSQTDLVIGTPVHGRQQSELFELLGNFINVAALRVSCSADLNFLGLVQQVKKITQEAQAYADLPFETIVAELKIPRDPGRTPLYSSMVFFQDNSLQKLSIGDTPIESIALNAQTVDTDLVFFFERSHAATLAGLNFRTDLWDRETAQSFAQSFRSLLDQLLAKPEEAIGSLPLLDAATQSKIRSLGQKTCSRQAPELTLDRWILDQAAELGARTAVEAIEGPSLSYAELHAATLRMASYLHQKGVRRGSIVGVCLPRRGELIVSLCALLRLGAAYLPLDPLFPAARLHAMLDDSGANLVITEMEFFDLFTEGKVPSLCIDRERLAIDACPEASEAIPSSQRDDSAYLIYTSGSSGQPKGVEITHSAAVHFLFAISEELALPPGLRTLAITTVSFDISVLEIFGTLALGGTIVLVPAQLVNDGPQLSALLSERRIDLLQATPASWRLLLANPWPKQEHLLALSGGEAMTRDLARLLLLRVGTLWNVYGPTEATVWATAGQITDPELPISIGRVLPGYEAYILDALRQPLPLGVAGRLFLAGPALARGYHGQEALTAERFPPHCFLPKERMYDTGDLARLRSDGQIEYLGRRDQQVKLRGYRIELGEIETLLSEHPAVEGAVCSVREIVAGDQRLIAYLQLREGESLDLPTVHRHLQARLPKYMLPQILHFVSSFPLTGSGKIDRKRLPDPEAPAPSQAIPIKGLSPEEEGLARLFREILGLTHVRSSDNFFDLGGHSLLALQVLHRCQTELGLTLRIRDLLLLNISQLAARLQPSDPGSLRKGDRR